MVAESIGKARKCRKWMKHMDLGHEDFLIGHLVFCKMRQKNISLRYLAGIRGVCGNYAVV